MSADAIKAFRSIRPYLPGLLDGAQVGKYSRPSAGALVAVGEELAWRYNPARRGYLDETVEQLCESLPLGYNTVKRSLQALHALGLWTVDRRGGSKDRYGSRRIPGPELCAAAHRLGLNLATPQTALNLGPELGSMLRRDTTELGSILRRDTESTVELRTELSATLRGTERNLARNSAQPCARPKKERTKETTTRATLVTPAPPELSSSSSVYSIARKAARQIAGRAKRAEDTGYVNGILRHWRSETDDEGLTRFDKLRLWEQAGVSLERCIELVSADAPLADASPQPPPKPAHPLDCACEGLGLIPIDEDGTVWWNPCQGANEATG